MYILTGGAGFIGSAMLRKLNDQGIEDILVVDHLGSNEKWKNLSLKSYADYMDKGEFRTRLRENRLPDKVSAVIHMGACSSTTVSDASYMMENNYCYTRELADWALAKGVRMLYASSGATYGLLEGDFSDDDSSTLTLEPLNIYGYSKHLFDLWAIRSGASAKMAGLKFFNVFGPNEYHKDDMRSVVVKAYEQVQSSGRARLFKSHRAEYGDGEQKRDFVYVKDCVDVMWWLLENPKVNGIFNVGTGNARTWNDLVNALFTALGKPTRIDYVDMPENLVGKYQYYTQAGIDKLRAAGYKNEFTKLEGAVKDYVTNYLTQDFKRW